MDTNIAINKLELTKWIIDLEDKNILDEIMQLMKHKKETHFYTEEEARRISQEKIEAGITGEELKKRMFDYIDTLPWKK